MTAATVVKLISLASTTKEDPIQWLLALSYILLVNGRMMKVQHKAEFSVNGQYTRLCLILLHKVDC